VGLNIDRSINYKMARANAVRYTHVSDTYMTALETDDCDHYIKTHGRKTATIDVVGALANVMIDLR